MKKFFTLITLVCLTVVNAMAAKSYVLDAELTWDQVKDGSVAFALVSGDKVLYGSGAQNAGFADVKTALSSDNAAITWKVESETAGTLFHAYAPNGDSYVVWGGSWLNSQPAVGGATFILGKSGKNESGSWTGGQDMANGAVWTVTATEGGYTIQNVGNNGYLAGTTTTATADNVWKFYSIKEGEEVVEEAPVYVWPTGAVDLTKEMFLKWDGVSATATSTGSGNGAYEIGKASGLPYGDGNVHYSNYADLSAYNKLIILVKKDGGIPRLLLNRAEDPENKGGYIEIKSTTGDYVAADTCSDGHVVFTYDLAAIKAKDGYVHLNCIKGANYANVYVYGMKMTAATVDPEPEPTPVVADGEYILQNVEAGGYLGGSQSWGTQASVLGKPQWFGIKGVDGKYTLDSHQYNNETAHFLNGELWCDQGETKWAIEKISDGIYTISIDGKYIASAGMNKAVAFATEVTAAAQWKIISLADVVASQAKATAEAPVDVTAFIKNPELKRNANTTFYPTWTITSFDGTDTPKNFAQGQNGNVANCAESYHSANGFKFTQTVTGLKKGVYAISASAFYRQDGSDAENMPYIFAGEQKSTFPVKTGTENSMAEAYTSFLNGLYKVDPIYVEVAEDNGSIEIGGANANTTMWNIFGEFSMTYYGAEASIAEIKAGTIIKDYNAATGKLMNKTISKTMEDAHTAFVADPSDANLQAFKTAVNDATASVKAYKTATNNLPEMKKIVDAANVYTKEAVDTYYNNPWAAYNDSTLTNAEAAALQNPNVTTGWRASATVSSLLMSAFGGNTADWNNLHINTWSTEGDTDGSNFRVPFYEYWTGDGNSLGEKTITGTLSNMKPGKYQVKALVRVRIKNGAEAPATGITLDVNGGEAAACAGTQVGTSQFYLQEVTAKGVVAEDSVLNINFKVAAENNVSWLTFKELVYTAIPDGDITEWTFNDDQSPVMSTPTNAHNSNAHAAVINPAEGNNFLNVWADNNKTKASTAVITEQDMTKAVSWTLEFDWAGYSGCNKMAGATSILDAAGKAILSINDEANWGTTMSVTGGNTVNVYPCNKDNRISDNTGAALTANYWYHITLVGNNGGIKLTAAPYNAEGVLQEATIVKAQIADANASPKTLSIQPGSCGAMAIDNLKLTASNVEVKSYDYKVKYVCGETEVKETATRNDVEGAAIALSATDKAKVAIGDKLYLYVSDDAEGKTVTNDNATVVTVTYREAADVDYTINAVIGDTKTAIITGKGKESETLQIAYPAYQVADGTLYTAKKLSSDGKGYYFLLEMAEGATKDIEYTATETTNVVFYSEAEKIEGLTLCNNGNTVIRSSNGASAYAKDAAVAITTLKPGKYQIKSIACDAAGKNASAVFEYTDGTNVLFTQTCAAINWDEQTSAEFELTEETTIYLAAGGKDSQGIDAIIITGAETATAVNEVAADAATAPAKYIVNGKLVISNNDKQYNAAGVEVK